jgi:hypothetical protein
MTKTAAASPRRVNPGTSATLLGAVLNEVDVHETRLQAVEHALAPAFSPREGDISMTATRGPGAHAPEPFVMRQASTLGDPWAGDVEHSAQYMHDIVNGTPMTELGRISARDAVMRHEVSQPSPVLHESPRWCGKFFPWGQCRPATPCPSCQGHRTVVRDSSGSAEPPLQRTMLRAEWEPDPPAMQELAARDTVLTASEKRADAAIRVQELAARDAMAERVAGFMTARQHALPQRPPGEGEQIVKGL